MSLFYSAIAYTLISIPSLGIYSEPVLQCNPFDLRGCLEESTLVKYGHFNVITGHEYSKLGNGTVADIDKLEIGDKLRWKRKIYEVYNKKIIRPSNVGVLNREEDELALITCWPPGSTDYRLVVFTRRQ